MNVMDRFESHWEPSPVAPFLTITGLFGIIKWIMCFTIIC